MHFVLLVFFAFCSLVFMLLLFLTMNPHYMIHITLFSTAALKKMKPFFAIMPVHACICILCHRYQLCLRFAVPNEHIRPVSVCDEQQTSLQWVAVAGQCGRHTCVCTAHTQAAYVLTGTSQSGLCCFSTDSDKDCVVYTCRAECAAREQSRSNS